MSVCLSVDRRFETQRRRAELIGNSGPCYRLSGLDGERGLRDLVSDGRGSQRGSSETGVTRLDTKGTGFGGVAVPETTADTHQTRAKMTYVLCSNFSSSPPSPPPPPPPLSPSTNLIALHPLLFDRAEPPSEKSGVITLAAGRLSGELPRSMAV